MATSDILDGAIKLLRANARTMVLIVATFFVPFEIVLAFFERNINGGNGFLQTLRDPSAASSQNSSSSTFAIAGLSYIAFWVVVPLVCAGASRVVMASYLGGELKPRDAIVAAIKHAPALLVATLIVHLAELVSLLAVIVGAAFVMPLFIMTAPAISLEDLGPFAGIRRSVSLARRRYWPTVGIALLSGLLAYFLNQILGFLPALVTLFIGLRWGWLIVAASGILEAFVTVSLITIVATLVYIDARIRQEGFDLQVMASRLDAG
ncbi:MAG: hypothetical protein QOF30_375 [Acidimicrobiaceae bacterium]|jgi:hypothetical protein|nr:hypothetical protein [Acidimicrobiaceae bacterium]